MFDVEQGSDLLLQQQKQRQKRYDVEPRSWMQQKLPLGANTHNSSSCHPTDLTSKHHGRSHIFTRFKIIAFRTDSAAATATRFHTRPIQHPRTEQDTFAAVTCNHHDVIQNVLLVLFPCATFIVIWRRVVPANSPTESDTPPYNQVMCTHGTREGKMTPVVSILKT